MGGPKRGHSFLFCDARALPPAEGVALGEGNHEATLERAVRLKGSDRPIVLGESGYQRVDLASLLSRCGDEARALFSCPSFDEIHVGYADRSSLATLEAERAICPAKNGMFRPIVIKDGRVIAVQDPREGYAFLDSARDEYDQSLLEEAEEIGEYLSGK